MRPSLTLTSSLCLRMLSSLGLYPRYALPLIPRFPCLGGSGANLIGLVSGFFSALYSGLAFTQTPPQFCPPLTQPVTPPTQALGYLKVDGFFFPYRSHEGYSFRPLTVFSRPRLSGRGAPSSPLRAPLCAHPSLLGPESPNPQFVPNQRLVRRLWPGRLLPTPTQLTLGSGPLVFGAPRPLAQAPTDPYGPS
jgi:hypothetical protein